MAILPDPATAGIAATAVFLITLGILVVFIETVAFARFLAVVAACFVLALVLVAVGETGLAFLPLAFGGAFIANQFFEWLTTR